MQKKRYVTTLLILLGMMIAGGITTAKAPVEQYGPCETALPVSEGERMAEDAKVYQTMYFLRCGHSVSRRTELADAVKQGSFSDVQAYYSLWTVLETTKEQVKMERQLDLFCPMHQVVSLNEAGQVILSENRYGDGMAVKKVYDTELALLPQDVRNALVAGIGFDSEAQADAWMEEKGIGP